MLGKLPHLGFWLAIVFCVVFSLLALFLRFAVMPNIEGYQGRIVSRVAEVSRMDVSAKNIRGGWLGFRPFVELTDVAFLEVNTSEPALRLPKLKLSLSWWALLLGDIRFNQVILSDAVLTLSRDKDGLIYFAGKPLNNPNANDNSPLFAWLLAQTHVEVRNATLSWADELGSGTALQFNEVQLRVEKSGDWHQLGFSALPPANLATRIDLQAKLKIEEQDKQWQSIGTIFIAANQANLAQLRLHLPMPLALKAGLGNVRAWLQLDTAKSIAKNPLQEIIADINVIEANVQIAEDLEPLTIADLNGRVSYRVHDGGYTIGSKALEFRTHQGVVQKPADFSLTLLNQANALSNEIAANGIELNVMAALLQYFPVGKEVRELVSRFAPRGKLLESRLIWKGELSAASQFEINSKVSDFAIRADGNLPGISGLTARIKGNDKEGTLTIDSQNLALDMPTVFRAPLFFDSVKSEAAWKKVADNFSINIARASFANPATAGEFAGRYWREADSSTSATGNAGNIDIKGSLSRATAVRVMDYLPNEITRTRDYLAWAIQGGEVDSAEFVLKGELDRFPFRAGTGGQFAVKAKISNVQFRHTEGWPGIEQIYGELDFENSRFAAHVEAGKIFSSTIKNTVIGIDDMMLDDPLLTIKGEANAGGKDITRYLRESPLVENVGAFTRTLQIEGNGKLDLALSIPLVSDKPTRVNGKYQISNASVKLDLGPTITAIKGSVQFTESSVKSSEILGTALGHPLAASLSGGGAKNNDVVLAFNGHSNLAQLVELLPFAVPVQLKGEADFSGRVISKSVGTDIVIESNLLGISSTLPVPMSKRSDEAKMLSVSFTNTGSATERIRVQYAEQIDARLQRKFDARGNADGLFGGVINIGQSPIDSPVPAGLWLAGNMPGFDFDLWRKAIALAYPVAAAAVSATASNKAGTLESSLTGFDLKLGSLLAFGRPFSAMTIKGRSSGGDWLATADGADISGDITWRPNAYNEHGSVRARLTKFVLTDGAEDSPSASSAVTEGDVPALDVVAEHFSLNNREWGKLDLQAEPSGADWKIAKLLISNGHAVLDANGLWTRNAASGKSRTTLNLKLNVKNLNALFNQFGYKDLRGGSGSLSGTLSWPGHVYQYVSDNLSGQFNIKAVDGQFDKIAPGAGKLLSLISLQSIPRRLTFDFHDLFSEGFAFNSINGDCKIENGIIGTNNFEIVGTSAEVKMEGEVSLPKETQNLKLTIAPKLGEGIAIGAGILFTPVVGAAVLAVEKLLQNPIDKILSYQYSVTGTWDNPLVERINKNPPPVPPPPTPPASTPSASTPAK